MCIYTATRFEKHFLSRGDAPIDGDLVFVTFRKLYGYQVFVYINYIKDIQCKNGLVLFHCLRIFFNLQV